MMGNSVQSYSLKYFTHNTKDMAHTIERLGTTYDLDKVEDCKKLLERDNAFIAVSDKRLALTKKYIKEAKWLELRIWKMEKPDSFENHRQALADYVQHPVAFAN